MIRCLRYRQVKAIIDIKLGDSDADSYKYETMAALLDRWETIKKDKHDKNCHDQRLYFSPFVLSLDEMLGSASLVVTAQFSRVAAAKREKSLLQIQGWVSGQIEIAVARSYSRMIRGTRLPSPLW